MQFHEINYDNDPEWIVERGGLAELLKAQKAGKVRFVGFTGHKDPRIHLKMLDKHKWDTVQMPINVCDYFYRSFVHQVVPEATKRGIAPIGMKSLGWRQRSQGPAGVGEGLHRRGGTPVCPEPGHRQSGRRHRLDGGAQTGSRQRPRLQTADRGRAEALLAKVKPVAGDGRHERFKSTQFFDGPYHRKQHDLTEKDVQG